MVAQPPVGERAAWTDLLQPGPIDGFATAGGNAVAASWEEASWQWTSTEDPELLSLTEGPVEAAATTSEGLWVQLDGELLLFDDVLREVPWSPGPVDWLRAADGQLWLHTGSALLVRQAGRLSEIQVGGQVPSVIAPGGRIDGTSVVWIADGALAVAVDPVTGEVLTGSDLGGPVTSLAVDASRAGHAVANGALWQQDGDAWIELDLEGAVATEVFAHPDARGVWVATDGGWMHVDGLDRYRVSDVDAQAPQIDGWGRLVYATETGLWRVAANRPTEILGVVPSERIEAPVDLQLVPTESDAVTALTAEVVRGADTVELSVVDDVARLDPLGLVFGTWTVRVTASYGTDIHTTEVPLKMAAASGATWGVQPIYEERCSMCHDGASETVLENPEDWSTNLDAILDNVMSGEMPLVGPPLDSSQIALIQAWAAGGFAQ